MPLVRSAEEIHSSRRQDLSVDAGEPRAATTLCPALRLSRPWACRKKPTSSADPDQVICSVGAIDLEHRRLMSQRARESLALSGETNVILDREVVERLGALGYAP